jgi:hypothetical protein
MIYLNEIEEESIDKYSFPALLTLALVALFWAYVIIGDLL